MDPAGSNKIVGIKYMNDAISARGQAPSAPAANYAAFKEFNNALALTAAFNAFTSRACGPFAASASPTLSRPADPLSRRSSQATFRRGWPIRRILTTPRSWSSRCTAASTFPTGAPTSLDLP